MDVCSNSKERAIQNVQTVKSSCEEADRKKVKRPLLIMALNVIIIESFYKDEGIVIYNTTKGTPQQYSAAKRINKIQRSSHAL